MSEKEKKIVKKYLAKLPREKWDEWYEKSFLEVIGKQRPDIPDEKLREEFDEICKEIAGERSKEFQQISLKEVVEILGLTIKQDEINKVVTFLCELSAFTENAQFNISYNAPSSTGKSYIPTEIARLFPEEDMVEVGYCSPTAFFHDYGETDKKHKGRIVVNLERKIIIFLDQPHTQLLARLRPLLSHDKKEIQIKITDKSQKQGLRTKNVILRGFPAVIFCTAGLRIDEQEATRFILLSPEVNQEKIREGIEQKIKKEADPENFVSWLEANPERTLLRERIWAIKDAGIIEVKIGSPEKIEKLFFQKNTALKPRHQRDIGRFISLIKVIALLNLWFRERARNTIVANDEDIDAAFAIWEKISVSQEMNLPPYIYNLYQDVILPAWNEKNGNRSEGFVEAIGFYGISRQEILQKHYKVYGRMLDTNQLRQQILPMLETAGLITEEADQNDRRKMLIYLTAFINKTDDQKGGNNGREVSFNEANNSETQSGVNSGLIVF